MSLDWHTAYLNQARADYERYLELSKRDEVPVCYQLQYLQMATEKLAKSFLSSAAGTRPPRVHDAFVEFVTVAKRRDDLRRLSGYTKSSQFRAYVSSLLPKAREVEDLSPEGPDHPNPEYPWDVGGIIISPLDYEFSSLDPKKDTRMRKLIEFIEDCFRLS
ncbi:MAG: hypothetical protein M3Y56_01530 [Armatimonadota bacterium]|nr:hypothetical protein [Armatimonadota bacterium]